MGNFNGNVLAQKITKKGKDRTFKHYIPACSSLAKIASFAFKPYFSISFSPFITCISSKGFPIKKIEHVDPVMIVFSIIFVDLDDGQQQSIIIVTFIRSEQGRIDHGVG